MKCIVRANDLKRLVDNTKKFLGGSRYQKILQYIYLEINVEDNEVKATALNCHTVSEEYAMCVEADQSFSCFIKPNIPKITKKDMYAEIELINGKCYITVGENIVGFVQPEAEYPKVHDQILNWENQKPLATVCLRKDLLLAAVQSLRHDYRQEVRIEIREGKMPVIFRTDAHNTRYVLPYSNTNWDGK